MSVLFDPKLERMAKDGNEMPDGLSVPQQIAFLCLRKLYWQLAHGIIDRETAVNEKRKIMREHESYVFIDEYMNRYVRAIKETELAREAYLKNPSKENADNLMKAFYWVERKDS